MKHLSKILIGFLLFFSMVAHSVLAATRDQKLTTQVTVYNCASTQLGAPTIVSKPPAGTGMMYAIPTGGTDVNVTCDANNFDAAAHSSIQVTLSRTAPLIIQYAYDASDYCQFSLTAVNGKPEITAKSAGKVTCTVKNGAMMVNTTVPPTPAPAPQAMVTGTMTNLGDYLLPAPTYITRSPGVKMIDRPSIFGKNNPSGFNNFQNFRIIYHHHKDDSLSFQWGYDSSNYCQFSFGLKNNAPIFTVISQNGSAKCQIHGTVFSINGSPTQTILTITAKIDRSLYSQIAKYYFPTAVQQGDLYFGMLGQEDYGSSIISKKSKKFIMNFPSGATSVTGKLLNLIGRDGNKSIPILFIGSDDDTGGLSILGGFYCKNNFQLRYNKKNSSATIQFSGSIIPKPSMLVTCKCSSGNACPTQ